MNMHYHCPVCGYQITALSSPMQPGVPKDVVSLWQTPRKVAFFASGIAATQKCCLVNRMTRDEQDEFV